MSQRASNAKSCVTCEFWAGPRATDASLMNVKFEMTDKGKCLYRSRFGTPPTPGDFSCSYFKKWGVLK